MFGAPPGRDQKMRAGHFGRLAAGGDRDRDRAASLCDPRRVGVGQDADALALEDLADPVETSSSSRGIR